MKYLSIFLVIVALFTTSQSIAQVHILEIKELDKDKKYYFFPYFEIWTDTSNQKNLAEVFSSPEIKRSFKPFDVQDIDLFAHSYWLKCQVNNLSGDSLRIGLQAGVFEQLDIYLLEGDSLPKPSPKPIIQRIMKKRFTPDYLTLPKGKSVLYFHVSRKQDFYIAMTKIGFEGMMFFRGDFSDFWIEKKDEMLAFSLLYFGGILLLFFYNLFLLISLKDKTYFFYLLSLVWVGVFIFGNKDLYGLWVAPEPPKYLIWLMWITHAPYTISQLLFMYYFLKLRDWLPYATYTMIGLVILGALLTFSLFIPSLYPYVPATSILYIVVAHLFFFAVSFLAFIKKKQNARFYFLGNMALSMGALVYVADEMLKLIPSSIFTVNALLIGSLIEMTLFSLALANRINQSQKALVQQKLQQAEEREKIIEEKNKELEIKVQERTLALQKSNEELQKSNQTKDKLFSIISHDLRSPIAALKGFTDILDPNILTNNELEIIKKELIKQLNATDDTLKNLLLWANSQMQGEIINPKNLNLHQLVSENFDFLANIAKQKEIKLLNKVDVDEQVFADENHLRAILRNLIANALKFSYQNGEITISSEVIGENVQIAVKDTGIGISAEEKEKLFANLYFSTKGTAGEKGSGLGLTLVKELVEKNGGKIWAESEPRKGSTFYFTLKNIKAIHSSV
jgi:signal transduction histidine kinase